MKDTRNMTLKEVMAYCLVLALGLILIIHFILFWIYGGVFICEHNKIILALETLMSIGIIAFGIERIISTSIRNVNKEGAVSFSNKAHKQVSHDSYNQERRQVPQPMLQR